jgi:hypothetical protein
LLRLLLKTRLLRSKPLIRLHTKASIRRVLLV